MGNESTTIVNNYQKEIQKLKNEEKKNEQLHIERMKDLANNENKINLYFRQTIRKYDDEKEINILKENNNIFSFRSLFSLLIFSKSSY